MNEKIKAFETQLLVAINVLLRKKEFLQNGKGIRYHCANPASNGLALHFSSQHDEDLLLNFLDCTTNPQPCLSGDIYLTLKKEGGARYSRMCYHFHICTNNYEVTANNTYEIIVKNITFLVKQNYRLY